MPRIDLRDSQDDLIGYVKYGDCKIILLEIDRRHRRKGWGSNLLHQAEQAMIKEGCRKITVFPGILDPLDPPPDEFYRKMGYRSVVWNRGSRRMFKNVG